MNLCPVFLGRLNVADGDLSPYHKLELSVLIGWRRFKAHLWMNLIRHSRVWDWPPDYMFSVCQKGEMGDQPFSVNTQIQIHWVCVCVSVSRIVGKVTDNICIVASYKAGGANCSDLKVVGASKSVCISNLYNLWSGVCICLLNDDLWWSGL